MNQPRTAIAAVVLFVGVAALAFALYSQPVPQNLWVVPDASDPLPGTPYTRNSLEGASARPLLGTTMEVVDPADFPDRMAADDGSIATLVFHIDTLEDVDPELPRRHFRLGAKIVLIGGDMHALVNWLGTHMQENETSAEVDLQGEPERSRRDDFWPAANIVAANGTTGGCGAASGSLSLGSGGNWISPRDIMQQLVTHPCNHYRRELLSALEGEIRDVEAAGAQAFTIIRRSVGRLLYDRDGIVRLTRHGELFELPASISELPWTQATIDFPLMTTSGTHGTFGAHIFDLEQEQLVLTYSHLIEPLKRDWADIGGEERRSAPFGEKEGVPEGLEASEAAFGAAAYAPDGTQLAFLTRHCLSVGVCDWTVGVADAGSGDVRFTRVMGNWFSNPVLAWAPDGRSFAYAGQRSTSIRHEVYVDRIAGPERQSVKADFMEVDRSVQEITALDWHDDGSAVLVITLDSANEKTVWRFTVDDAELSPLENGEASGT